MAAPMGTRWRLEAAGVHRPVTAGDVGGTKATGWWAVLGVLSPAPRANGVRSGGALGWVVQLLKRSTSGGELDSRATRQSRRGRAHRAIRAR
jgi:hypothetical protein